MKKNIFAAMQIICLLILSGMISYSQTHQDIVKGNLIQFNDNGRWCWYQDERAVVDMDQGKILLGSAASGGGLGGSVRNGVDDAVIFDLQSQTSQRYFLIKYSYADDHHTAGFIVRPDGKYLALYDQHYENFVTRYRIFDGSRWAAEQTYDWRAKPGGIDYTLAYNNVYYLSAEGKMYNFQRANHRTPNFIVSTDMGDTWTWGGQLTTNTSNTYNKGYYKYWSNGIDRIDFIFTEQHPRDTTTSIYHGYIKNGHAYDSYDTMVDSDIYDTTFIPAFWNFTKVFSNNTIIGADTMKRCWQADCIRYDDGTIAAIITARTNQYFSYGYNVLPIANPDHAFIYCRFDGNSWSYTYLAKAGLKLLELEEDYTGLGALCPNDPNTLYISTPYSPIDPSINLGVREIWKGVTSDDGITWTWTPITQNSVRDNFRPIIPLWDNNNTALLWCRGTYSTFDGAVVGIIDRKSETIDKMTYVDASHLNTTFETGSPITTTGPDSQAGPADDQWHERSGFGNGGSVFTSCEINPENAPALATRVNPSSEGIYDVWVNFWANPTADWRIKAGLSEDRMQIFRQITSKQVEEDDHISPITLTGGGNTFLYQAYLGRVNVTSAVFFNVFIDDSCLKTGADYSIGDLCRTWYDGVSYAKVNEPAEVSGNENIPAEFNLSQNYPNPFNPNTVICYKLKVRSEVKLIIYDILGRQIAALVDEVKNAGDYNVEWDGTNSAGRQVSSGVYFYQLKSNIGFTITKKMLLIR